MIFSRCGVRARTSRWQNCKQVWLRSACRSLWLGFTATSCVAAYAKKTAHARAQDRPDVLKQRHDWFDAQLDLEPERLVFIDETWTATNMILGHDRCDNWFHLLRILSTTIHHSLDALRSNPCQRLREPRIA